MKKARKLHNEDEVIRSLSSKNDIRISKKIIEILIGPKRKGDLGNKSWGKIDFLTNYCGYSIVKVKTF